MRAVDEQTRNPASGFRLTNVAARANISYDRLLEYLDDLSDLGLLDLVGDRPEVTPKGREFLKAHREWSSVLERFGMA
jgi:predicted transcriptional regulator